MDSEQKILRFGATVIAGAIILRLLSGGVFGSLVKFFSDPKVVSVLLFMETGRVYREPQSEPVPQDVVQPPQPMIQQPLPEEKNQAVFSQTDAAMVSFINVTNSSVDTEKLLAKPLTWDLTIPEPTVLIVHSHTTESYTGNYQASSAYHTLDEANNMLAIGDKLEKLLTAAGVTVIHDRTVHDYPSYSGSYSSSRKSVKAYMEQYPTICLVLDLHRDASVDSKGNQSAATASINGTASAKLMLVVGSGSGGLTHPDWLENMSLAIKLQIQLEKLYPGLCRPINVRTQRFNQDLLDGALLIEVGTAGNTQKQALQAVQYLSDGIIALSKGAQLA